MIRVIHYIGLLDFGGSQSFIMEVYRKIDRNKVQFDFVTFPNQKKGFYEEIISLGGKIYESPKYDGKNHFLFMKWWNTFFKNHSEYKIFHCHVRSVAFLCIMSAHKNGVYSISHSHSTSNGKGILAFIKNVLQFPVRFQADFLFACSEKAGKWMYGNNVIKKRNYKVISNAIDTKRFIFSEETRKKIRNEFNISTNYVVGHVGRITEPKNHQFLINVFYEILKNRPDAKLLLVGDGNLRSSIEKDVVKKGLTNKVIFLGSRINTQDYYQAMDVFVFPSLWEGLGIVAIEAQAAGLPCIISERVPKEVDMGLDLVYVIPLNRGEKTWACISSNIRNKKRESNLEKIKQMGYDVTSNAQYLQNFYISIEIRGKKCI